MFELNLPSIESSFTQPAPTNPSANIDKIDHISKIDSVIACSISLSLSLSLCVCVCVCAQGVKKKINRMQQHERVCLPWSCLCKLLTRFLFCLSFLLFFHSYDERTSNLSIGTIFDRLVIVMLIGETPSRCWLRRRGCQSRPHTQNCEERGRRGQPRLNPTLILNNSTPVRGRL